MVQPINKVSEEMTYQAQGVVDDLGGLFQFFQINPYMLNGNVEKDSTDKKALKEIWMTSKSVEGDKMKVSPNITQESMASLKNSGYITGNDSIVEITEFGKRALKEYILDEEVSSFTKKASKQLISKNSYDFGDDVLVKVKHPEKFGAKYVSVSKKSFAKKKMQPMVIDSYNIQTRTASGKVKDLADYSEKELIAVLHLTKKIIKNASTLSLQTQKSVPVNRLDRKSVV